MCLIYSGCIISCDMPSLKLASLNIMTSRKVKVLSSNMADVCNESECIIKTPLSEMKGMQESTKDVRDR